VRTGRAAGSNTTGSNTTGSNTTGSNTKGSPGYSTKVLHFEVIKAVHNKIAVLYGTAPCTVRFKYARTFRRNLLSPL
jgi:hypothetical protein